MTSSASVHAPEYSGLVFRDQNLYSDELAILSAIPENVTVVADEHNVGAFLDFAADAAQPRHVFSVGELVNVSRFTCCYRFMPFWMKPQTGQRAGEIPVETQYLLAELSNGKFALFVPLVDGAFRATLQGSDENGLEIVVESGDPAVAAQNFCALFVAVDTDPYRLMEQSARSVMAHMQTGRLRRDKPLPSFVDQFGWCTWDSFYREVSQDKVRSGLETFATGGVVPKLLILDDGWQSVRAAETEELRLTAFAANEKFDGDLAPTVQMAKEEFGVETFIAWHALTGYYGGVEPDAIADYDVRLVPPQSSPGVLGANADHDKVLGTAIGLVDPHQIYRFFHEYHKTLRLQGVDGVKVDVQTIIESIGAGSGGRVELMRSYHEALEGSVQTHFLGNVINCMSCTNEMLYSTLNSTLTRTSDDFFPARPASHGLHLYANAFVSLWVGEFVHPDWDMFQSGHELGAFHAAARAISGGPVYVSDKPGSQDFDLLRKLVLLDGTVLRAQHIGRPTRDCLFDDPTHDEALLKIFNLNFESGVIGAFNARYDEAGTAPIAGSISPADVDGLAGERFVVYAHQSREMRIMARVESWQLSLPQLSYELFTVVPIDNGVAPIGLADMFNSAGAIIRKGWDRDGTYFVDLKAAGRVLLWCDKQPQKVEFNDDCIKFVGIDNSIEVTVPVAGVLRLVF